MRTKAKQEILDDAYQCIQVGAYSEAEVLAKLAAAMAGDVRRVRVK